MPLVSVNVNCHDIPRLYRLGIGVHTTNTQKCLKDQDTVLTYTIYNHSFHKIRIVIHKPSPFLSKVHTFVLVQKVSKYERTACWYTF